MSVEEKREITRSFFTAESCMRLIDCCQVRIQRSARNWHLLGVVGTSVFAATTILYVGFYSCMWFYFQYVYLRLTSTKPVASLSLPFSPSSHMFDRCNDGGRSYSAFSKHANGLVIAKLLNEFSIPQRNCDSEQKHERESEVCRKRDAALGQMQYSWPLTLSVHFART